MLRHTFSDTSAAGVSRGGPEGGARVSGCLGTVGGEAVVAEAVADPATDVTRARVSKCGFAAGEDVDPAPRRYLPAAAFLDDKSGAYDLGLRRFVPSAPPV